MIDKNKAALLEYPCQYEFKAIGMAGDLFRQQIVRAVSRYAELPAAAVRWQLSRSGTYQSVSLRVTLYSFKQLTEIYAEMKGVTDLKMLL